MNKTNLKKTVEPTHILHPFPALFDENSRILILGSFPSVKSREQNFFYGHPQNRFWKLMALIFDARMSDALPTNNSISTCDSQSANMTPINKAALSTDCVSPTGHVPSTIAEKTAFCHTLHIALWDTIHSCDIVGSSDSSITNVEPNDFSEIFKTAEIQQIYCNGKASFNLYQKYCEPVTERPAVCLPSTSPANAAWSLEKLYKAWSCIKN